jgi:rhomboid protease GluP
VLEWAAFSARRASFERDTTRGQTVREPSMEHLPREGEPAGPWRPIVASTSSSHPGFDPMGDEPFVPVRAGIDEFRYELLTATPRVFVGRALAVACVAVFALMVLNGVSPLQPTIEDLLRWGADSGPLVALEGQSWRVLSYMFVHVGAVHLGMNMWCLLSFGPLIERLYGNVAFAWIYVLSGVGGGLASLVWNPTVVSAGASGAIFGIIGGLGAFLLAHRRAIPLEVLVPLRSTTSGFVLFNLFFGAMMPGIDNAAHVGGLVTGFVVGLALQRRWPPSRDPLGVIRQGALGAALALTLYAALGPISTAIRKDPAVARFAAAREAESAYNAFIDRGRAPMREFEAINDDLNDQLRGLQADQPATIPDRIRAIQALAARSDANVRALQALETAAPELALARDDLIAAQREMTNALAALARALAQNRRDDLTGPDGFTARRDRALGLTEAFSNRLNRFQATNRE